MIFFTEKCRIQCKFFGMKYTPFEFYQKHTDILINYLKKVGKSITIQNLRDTIWDLGKQYKFKECTTFKPQIMKYFINKYNARKILDISSGWGDRLIGAMTCDIDCYHGHDPNECLYPRYKKIISFFKDHMYNKNADLKVELTKFEDSKLQDNYYDLVMSSPPYFDIEVYQEKNSNQSVFNKNEKEWYNSFLKVAVDKCLKALKNDGMLVLNINQFSHHHYVDWLLQDMKKIDDWEYNGMISYGQDNNNLQPIFIWRKK